MSHEMDTEYIFRIVHLGDSQELVDILDRNPTLNINIQNGEGESLLIHCVKRLGTKWTSLIGGEFYASCKILIERNIDLNIKDATGKSAAIYAAELQSLEVLRLLIQKGAHLDMEVLDSVIDKEDWILAICASLSRDSDEGTEEDTGQVSTGEKVKLKLFHRLLASNYLSSIRWMCELFPEIIERKNNDSLTAIHIVVIENNVHALKILLEFPANIEAVDSNGHTALHFAVDNGYIDCMLSLLGSGSAVNCQDSSGSTPLHYAINVGSDENKVSSDVIVEHLLKFGADMTLADCNGRLPLHWAANAGNANVCAMMVKNGSPVNARCNDGHTALHIVASQGYRECIRVLVAECGANVNVEDKYGHTPLFNAITTKNEPCVELLLYEDASPNHCNKQGNSPAHLAASKGLTEALELLVKYQGSLELKNNSGDLPIHEAALFQQEDAVRYILRCGCEVNVRNKQGFTPLHLAASVGSIPVCQCLLEGGAVLNCINTQCKNGIYKFLTPLDLAKLNKHPQCVSYLQTNGGDQGDLIVRFAARKIQRWWKSHSTPKVMLEPIEECTHDDSLEVTEEITSQEITERSTKDGTECGTKTGNMDQHCIPEHINNNEKLHHVEKMIPDENTSSAGNIPTRTSEMKETSGASNYSDKLETRPSKTAETKARTPPKQPQKGGSKSPKSKSKTSPSSKTVISTHEKNVSCLKKPVRKGSSKQRNTSVKVSGQAVKVVAPEANRKPNSTSRKKAEETKEMEGKLEVRTSNLHSPYAIKQHLKHSLDIEISRKEKLSKEIACLKKNLEERSQSLEKRLRVIEKNLEKQ